VIVHFVDIGGIDDQQCLSFLFRIFKFDNIHAHAFITKSRIECTKVKGKTELILLKAQYSDSTFNNLS
jgi:hypothetical protein